MVAGEKAWKFGSDGNEADACCASVKFVFNGCQRKRRHSKPVICMYVEWFWPKRKEKHMGWKLRHFFAWQAGLSVPSRIESSVNIYFTEILDSILVKEFCALHASFFLEQGRSGLRRSQELQTKVVWTRQRLVWRWWNIWKKTWRPLWSELFLSKKGS